MKSKTAFFLIVGMIGLVDGWAIFPVVMAQAPPSKPTLPATPANPSKPENEKLKVPELSKVGNDELATLALELSQKIQPKPNAMPGTQKDGFMENRELLLRLVNEVIILRERVEKLEQQAKKPERLN